MGTLSFRLIGRPVRQKQLLADRRALALVCLAGLGAAGIAGAAGYWGILGPQSTAQAARLDAVNAAHLVDPIVIPARGTPRFVLYGDSHARQYYAALAERFGPGALLSKDGCLSLPGLSNYDRQEAGGDECHGQIDRLVELLRTRKVRTLIWAQRWDRGAFDLATGRSLGMISGEAGGAFTAALERTLAMLPPDLNMVIIGNSPTAWAAGPRMSGGYLRCSAYINIRCPTSYPASMAEGRLVNRLLVAFARAHWRVEYVDAAAPLCPDGQCRILSGKMLYYADGSHFTPAAARLAVATIGGGLVP